MISFFFGLSSLEKEKYQVAFPQEKKPDWLSCLDLYVSYDYQGGSKVNQSNRNELLSVRDHYKRTVVNSFAPGEGYTKSLLSLGDNYRFWPDGFFYRKFKVPYVGLKVNNQSETPFFFSVDQNGVVMEYSVLPKTVFSREYYLETVCSLDYVSLWREPSQVLRLKTEIHDGVIIDVERLFSFTELECSHPIGKKCVSQYVFPIEIMEKIQKSFSLLDKMKISLTSKENFLWYKSIWIRKDPLWYDPLPPCMVLRVYMSKFRYGGVVTCEHNTYPEPGILGVGYCIEDERWDWISSCSICSKGYLCGWDRLTQQFKCTLKALYHLHRTASMTSPIDPFYPQGPWNFNLDKDINLVGVGLTRALMNGKGHLHWRQQSFMIAKMLTPYRGVYYTKVNLGNIPSDLWHLTLEELQFKFYRVLCSFRTIRRSSRSGVEIKGVVHTEIEIKY